MKKKIKEFRNKESLSVFIKENTKNEPFFEKKNTLSNRSWVWELSIWKVLTSCHVGHKNDYL